MGHPTDSIQKQSPMIRSTATLLYLVATLGAYAQTDSSTLFLQKGLQEKQAGRRMESLKNFEKAVNYNSANKTAVGELAQAYTDLRKYSLAKDTYKKLILLGDVSANNYRQLMNLSVSLKQQDDAILYATKLKQVEPEAKVNFVIGKVNYERENYGDAIQYLTAAAKEEPQNAEIPYMVARSYSDMMNYKQCIPYFEKAIQLDPSKNN